MSQEFFDFGFTFQANVLDRNFIVSESNRNALAVIESWPSWHTHAVLLHGPGNSGKTMLTEMWKTLSSARNLVPQEIYTMVGTPSKYKGGCYIIENIENVHDEAALLHFFNSVREDSGNILMTSRSSPASMKIRLPDLRSRINSIISAGVDNPDDELLRTLFFKYFIERQLKVEMNVVDYLVSRTERSFEAVGKTVEILDKHALQDKRNITIPFVKATFEKL